MTERKKYQVGDSVIFNGYCEADAQYHAHVAGTPATIYEILGGGKCYGDVMVAVKFEDWPRFVCHDEGHDDEKRKQVEHAILMEMFDGMPVKDIVYCVANHAMIFEADSSSEFVEDEQVAESAESVTEWVKRTF
jgi:hypothetical protein